ncbi:hypothetical protein ACJW31_07G026800 [Castanea mollissima]
MADEKRQLHLFFLPFPALGHLIPAIDMTKQFALRGLKISVITTPLNASLFSKTIEQSKTMGLDMNVLAIKFPCIEVGLPIGCESYQLATSHDLRKAAAMLEQPLEKLIQEYAPDCLVASTLFPWTIGVAEFSSDTKPFIIPNFPDEMKFTRKQLPEFFYTQNDQTYATKMYEQGLEAELMSFGAQIGPVSLCNQDAEDKAPRGKEASIDFHECFEWLNSKKPDSVVYVCFRSMANFNDPQLKEIAIGKEEWLPDGFEKRVKGKGLIIRGWAPQMMILDHEAVGGFVTHCGWISTLEGVSAGLPMVTWPVSTEQFFNENFVTQILRIGVAVGAQQWARFVGDSIKSEAIEKTVYRIMVGAEAEEIRSRARELGKKAKKAVEEGGSSYSDLSSLIEELSRK